MAPGPVLVRGRGRGELHRGVCYIYSNNLNNLKRLDEGLMAVMRAGRAVLPLLDTFGRHHTYLRISITECRGFLINFLSS